ncbi:MAG: universal stress protein [Methanocellales archaeon]|nr:universal stress protein [Methanocellales archaeon]
MVKKVLVPINPLKESGGLIETSIGIAKQLDASVHLVVCTLKDDTKETKDAKRRALDEYAEKHRKRGIKTTCELIDFGGGADELPPKIVDVAKGYDMIIMGHYGFDKMYRFIHQSTAQDVINLATCPVLVVTEGEVEEKTRRA